MSEIEKREKALKLALLKGDSKKVKWPTVAIPRSGFKRLPKVTIDKGEGLRTQ